MTLRPKRRVRLSSGQPDVRWTAGRSYAKPGPKRKSGRKPTSQKPTRKPTDRKPTSRKTTDRKPTSQKPTRKPTSRKPTDRRRSTAQKDAKVLKSKRLRTPPVPVTRSCPPGSYIETEVLEILLELDDEAGEGARPVPNIRTKSSMRKKRPPSIRKRLPPTSSPLSTERPQWSLPSRDQGAGSRRRQRGR